MMDQRGRRLLPSTVDWIADNSPDQTWAAMADGDHGQLSSISFRAFANAIDRTSWWVRSHLGLPVPGRRSAVAYIGPSDLRYYVFFMAIVKAGFTPLFQSHLNSCTANTHLFKATRCHVVLYGFPDLQPISANLPDVRKIRAQDSGLLWSDEPVQRFPFAKTFHEACDEPVLILHTSGSTGMPKPITYTHAAFAAMDARSGTPDWQGHHSEDRFRASVSRILVGFPPFHPSGALAGLNYSVFQSSVILLPPADRTLNNALVSILIDRAHVGAALLLPHVVEDLARLPGAASSIRRLKYLVWAGGPISTEAGDEIAEHTTLLNSYASSEAGPAVALLKRNPSDWSYHFFHPHFNGFVFRPVSDTSDVYELFIRRDRHITQQVFLLFPDLDEWATRDLFMKHPVKEHHWRLVGRADDMIVLSNGTKIVPRNLEAAALSAPGVAVAIAGGAKRPRPFLLVEPNDHTGQGVAEAAAREHFIDAIWPSIEEVNAKSRTNARIIRDLVIVVQAERPLPRTGKMTVQRGKALEMYEDDIERAFALLPEELKSVPDFRIGAEGSTNLPTG